MPRVTKKFLALKFLALAAAGVLAAAASAQATLIGFEAPEGYTAGSDLLNQPALPPKWTGSIGSNTSVLVTAGAGIGGSAGLRITTNGSINTTGLRQYDPADVAAGTNKVTYSFQFKPTLEAWGTTFLMVAPTDLSYADAAVTIEIKQDAGIGSGFRWHHGADTSTASIYPGDYSTTWRPVQIDVDWIAKTYQLTYDGTLMTKDGGPDYAFTNSAATQSNVFGIRPFYFDVDGQNVMNVMYLDDVSMTPASVPEPGTMVLVAAAGVAALIRRRRAD
jgi:hypothetical protein